MPYRVNKKEERYKPEDFYNIYTNESLKLDLWRPKQPNNPIQLDPPCILSYFGNKQSNF
jgi:hypothetical protein